MILLSMRVVVFWSLWVCHVHKVERDGLGTVIEIEQTMEYLLNTDVYF